MKQNKNLKRNGIIYLIISIIFLGISSTVYYQGRLLLSGEERYKKIQADFLKKEKQFNDLFDKLMTASIENTVDMVDFCQENKINSDFFVFFVYQDSVITAWSSNEIIPTKRWKDKVPQVLHIDNKWTYVQQKIVPKKQYIGYLVLDEFVGIGENISIINCPDPCNMLIESLKEEDKTCYAIYNLSGEVVFTLGMPNELKKSNIIAFIEIILWIITFTSLFFVLTNFLLRLSVFQKDKNRLFLILLSLLAVFPIIISNTFLFSSDLFSPLYYSSHYDSLGILFINSYIILVGSIFFMQFVSIKPLKKRSVKLEIVFSSFFIFLIFLIHIGIYALITGITNDSVVVLKPTMIYQYDLPSIVAIASIIFILWSAFIITYKILNEVLYFLRNNRIFVAIICCEIILSFLTFVIYYNHLEDREINLFIPYLLSLLLIIVNTTFVLRYRKWHGLLYYCIIYLILGGVVLFTANQTVDEREKKYKESMAEVVLSMEDPFILDSFQDLANEIEKDTVLASMFEAHPLDINTDDVSQYLVYEYSKKYSEDYRVNINIDWEPFTKENVRKNQTLRAIPLAEQAENNSKVSFRRIGFGRAEYTVRVAVPVKETVGKGEITLVFRMYISSQQQTELEKIVQKEMADYCYAGYENDILTMNAGNRTITYLYHLSDYELDTIYSGMEFVFNNITHTVFKHDNMVILVSSEKSIIWDKVAFLIILFLGQLIFTLLPIFLANQHYSTQNLGRFGFQESIQLFVIILVTITVTTAAFLFLRFFRIQKGNDLENTQIRVSQKTNKTVTSSIIELDNLTDLSNEALARINEELSHFYELDFLDLNLYNKKGENVERYGKGIYINTFINPAAIKALTLNKTASFVAMEFYNGRDYKSMYETILNKNGDIIGYTNVLRYKYKQREAIDYKQAQFLTQFMLTCIIIILLSVVSSIFLIRYLSRPLLRVTERLSKLKLGEELKEIEWEKDDELGALVNTYNILIDRLKSSAELLEKSSQEIAWKDMAKQVAHEIKNPLTPMRLTTQHLRRELGTNNSIDKEKLEHYFSMIIQQTDTLTDIANSFSNFAKINQREGSPEDLLPIIKNTLASFTEIPDILFHFENKTGVENVISFVNKSQISQVFNNLIKNAKQAKKPDEIQSISIEIENHGDKMWLIKIADTGIGMTDEVKTNLFSPNFTTKTSGTGLGMAMVQRIIATWGGDITFESTHNVGTTFFITLPKSN